MHPHDNNRRHLLKQALTLSTAAAVSACSPLPRNSKRHPVIGPSPNNLDVYLAIMHSGVTLAPVVGQLVASELSTGNLLSNLGSYRPSRDFVQTIRY